MMALGIFALLYVVTSWFQWQLLKHVSLSQRFLGWGLLTLAFALLLPPILGWQKQQEVSQKDQFLGWVLWDESASFKGFEAEKKSFKKDWKEQILETSNGWSFQTTFYPL